MPPPALSLRVLPSAGCTMSELSRAVERRRQATLACLGRDAKGSLRVSCTFDAAGAVLTCVAEPPKASTYSKSAVACLEKSLAALKLDPKASDPTKCAAQIEVRAQQRPYHRPSRGPNLNDPFSGF